MEEACPEMRYIIIYNTPSNDIKVVGVQITYRPVLVSNFTCTMKTRMNHLRNMSNLFEIIQKMRIGLELIVSFAIPLTSYLTY